MTEIGHTELLKSLNTALRPQEHHKLLYQAAASVPYTSVITWISNCYVVISNETFYTQFSSTRGIFWNTPSVLLVVFSDR